MLHLITADLPSDALALVGQLQGHCAGQAPPPALLDLSGEAWLAHRDWGASAVTVFRRGESQRQVWERVRPGLGEWLALLQQEEARSERCPPVPGLGQLLQVVALAEWLAQPGDDGIPVDSAFGEATPGTSACLPGGDRERLVLLPPLHQALELLELAQMGPALLDQWLEPLLLWWQETRKSLSRLDLLLRLSLPEGDALRLAPLWQQRLQQLADLLADPQRHQWLCVLDGGAGMAIPLCDRLCQVYVKGFQPARLWLAGAATEEARQALAPIRGPLVIGHGPQLHAGGPQVDAWLARPWQAEPRLQWQLQAEPARCSLLLPGLRKQLLQVQQIDRDLLVAVGGSSCLLPLPAALAGQRCTGAKLSGRHLQLQFQ